MQAAGTQTTAVPAVEATDDLGGAEPDETLAALSQLAPLVDERLAAVLEREPMPESLREAIGYSLLAPGKRVRPALALRCAEAVGGTLEQALPAAAALELVHAFSLVHDDLPAMDDDDLRRGRPTLHVARGEAMAILAGDAMLSLAFVTLARVTPGERGAALSRELADATMAMIGGQVWDTLGGVPEDADGESRLRLIHDHKTGALIRASCRMGAISGGADEAATDALGRYGEAIGLMFQIVDDLLDVEQSSERTGKRTGKDEAAGKLTYPSVLGVEASRAAVERERSRANEALAPFGDRAASLRSFADYLAVRTR